MLATDTDMTEADDRKSLESAIEDNEVLLRSTTVSMIYRFLKELTLRSLFLVTNGIVARQFSNDVIGVANVRLALLYNLIVGIGKSGIRNVCVSKTSGDVKCRDIINMAWMCTPIGLLCAVILCPVWLLLMETPDASITTHYLSGVVLYAASAILHMLTEPFIIIGQKYLYVRTAEIINVISQLVATLTLVLVAVVSPDLGVMAFSISTLVLATVYFVGYAGYFIVDVTRSDSAVPLQSPYDFLPKFFDDREFLHPELWGVSLGLFKQTLIEQILSRGEEYVMTSSGLLTFSDQGLYHIVRGLVNLFHKGVALSLEDSVYFLSCRAIIRGVPAALQQQNGWIVATVMFTATLKSLLLMCMTLTLFGWNYPAEILHWYAGTSLDNELASALLKYHCLFLLTQGFSKIACRFCIAVMDEQAIGRYNRALLVQSTMLPVCGYGFTVLLGPTGIIIAKLSYGLARLGYSLSVLRWFLAGSGFHPLGMVTPRLTLLVTYLVGFGAVCACRNWFKEIQFTVLAVSVLAFVVTTWLTEKKTANKLYRMFVVPYCNPERLDSPEGMVTEETIVKSSPV